MSSDNFAEKIKSFLIRLFYLSVIIFPFAVIGYFIFSTDYFRITNVTVIDARPHVEAQVREKIDQFLASEKFIIPRANLLFLQKNKMEDKLEEEIYPIYAVKIQKKIPGVLKIIVQEKKPVAIFFSHSQYFYMDHKGLIFEKMSIDNLPQSSLSIIKNLEENNQIEIKIGSRVVSERFMDFILELMEKFPKQITDFLIAEISIPSVASQEVHIKTNKNFSVYFDITRTPESQLIALQKVWQEIIKEEEKEKLEYIDLRIDHKVYYKSS